MNVFSIVTSACIILYLSSKSFSDLIFFNVGFCLKMCAHFYTLHTLKRIPRQWVGGPHVAGILPLRVGHFWAQLDIVAIHVWAH